MMELRVPRVPSESLNLAAGNRYAAELVSTFVVDVCVGRLRSKLNSERIETVRNVGYCFVAS